MADVSVQLPIVDREIRQNSKIFSNAELVLFWSYFLPFRLGFPLCRIAACAAASRAIGTRYGEQLT